MRLNLKKADSLAFPFSVSITPSYWECHLFCLFYQSICYIGTLVACNVFVVAWHALCLHPWKIIYSFLIFFVDVWCILVYCHLKSIGKPDQCWLWETQTKNRNHTPWQKNNWSNLQTISAYPIKAHSRRRPLERLRGFAPHRIPHLIVNSGWTTFQENVGQAAVK